MPAAVMSAVVTGIPAVPGGSLVTGPAESETNYINPVNRTAHDNTVSN